MASFIWGVVALAALAFMGAIMHLAGNSARNRARQEELEEWEGVRDVRREAEEAKHNDPDAIERMRDKYNS